MQTAQGLDGARQSVTPFQSVSHPQQWPEERGSSPHPLGIPRILGRRARWVSARLRREA
ncbi:hypothetical protein ACFW1A_23355 [Kitasatospora sp. NPDC058965]|uniref:hypothetical protein n=1 Tax=Kitasatospora sp. NPDC058965 TaxID=3346682 RepID=UPI0036BA2E6F